jgi:hypothetical protein
MTWGGLVLRSAGPLLVLPLVLRTFSAQQVTVWLLFSSIVGFQLIFDLGFSSTFARVIAFAMGGATDIRGINRETRRGTGTPNWVLVGAIYGTMRFIYARLALGTVFMLGIFGSMALRTPIEATETALACWAAWIVVLLVSGVVLFGNLYSSYLQGLNHVAAYARVQSFVSLASIVSSVVVLTVDGGFFALVVTVQFWLLVAVYLASRLSREVENGRQREFRGARRDSAVLKAVWPSAWRSGVGVMLTSGTLYASNVVYATLGNTAEIVSYLLGLRLCQSISQFSQAPFYSKIPTLARLHSEGRIAEQVALARVSMGRAHGAFAILFLALACAGSNLLRAVGSSVAFVDPRMWSLLGVAFLGERFGAMHLQLYSVTNHVVWHTVAAGHAVLFAACSVSLYPWMGARAFPVGLMAGYWCWYVPLSVRRSYREFDLQPLGFERSGFLPALTIVLAYAAFAFLG